MIPPAFCPFLIQKAVSVWRMPRCEGPAVDSWEASCPSLGLHARSLSVLSAASSIIPRLSHIPCLMVIIDLAHHALPCCLTLYILVPLLG